MSKNLIPISSRAYSDISKKNLQLPSVSIPFTLNYWTIGTGLWKKVECQAENFTKSMKMWRKSGESKEAESRKQKYLIKSGVGLPQSSIYNVICSRIFTELLSKRIFIKSFLVMSLNFSANLWTISQQSSTNPYETGIWKTADVHKRVTAAESS